LRVTVAFYSVLRCVALRASALRLRFGLRFYRFVSTLSRSHPLLLVNSKGKYLTSFSPIEVFYRYSRVLVALQLHFHCQLSYFSLAVRRVPRLVEPLRHTPNPTIPSLTVNFSITNLWGFVWVFRNLSSPLAGLSYLRLHLRFLFPLVL
jgi:hypothetical protein